MCVRSGRHQSNHAGQQHSVEPVWLWCAAKPQPAAEGATESINVGIWDLGETARIDNSDGLVNVVAKSQRAVTLSAAQDTGTTADVNFNGGNSPLFGFVNQNADTTTVAEANFSLLSNNSLVNATGSALTLRSTLPR